jgi:septal ring factor EnvC (AmiA/AmiB activator)
MITAEKEKLLRKLNDLLQEHEGSDGERREAYQRLKEAIEDPLVARVLSTFVGNG